MKMTTKYVAFIFRQVADKIESGTCEADEDEIFALANTLIHRKLTSEQMCHHLNVSTATLTRMIVDGRVPKPKKTLGGSKYWWQDEVDDYRCRHVEKYGY